MGLGEETTPSRWLLYSEVCHTLVQTLAPALKLSYLIRHGPKLAKNLRRKRLNRPLQTLTCMKILC